jgi:hypothetical protein
MSRAADALKPKISDEQTEKKKSQQKAPKGTPPLVEQITKREDGDSAFATDTYAIMSNDERAMYSQNFYNILNTAPDGQATSWAYYNIQGSLRPIHTFNNANGTICRDFTEVLKVHNIQQTITGKACGNGPGTWCKLKTNSTPQCGLGHSPGAFDGLGSAIKSLF